MRAGVEAADHLKVDLLSGRGIDCKPAPGRIFLVGPRHSFEDLAEAIDDAFARWDLSHLHSFELGDGRRIGITILTSLGIGSRRAP